MILNYVQYVHIMNPGMNTDFMIPAAVLKYMSIISMGDYPPKQGCDARVNSFCDEKQKQEYPLQQHVCHKYR